MHPCQVSCVPEPMESALRRCSSNAPPKMHQVVGQEAWRAAANCMEMKQGGIGEGEESAKLF